MPCVPCCFHLCSLFHLLSSLIAGNVPGEIAIVGVRSQCFGVIGTWHPFTTWFAVSSPIAPLRPLICVRPVCNDTLQSFSYTTSWMMLLHMIEDGAKSCFVSLGIQLVHPDTSNHCPYTLDSVNLGPASC